MAKKGPYKPNGTKQAILKSLCNGSTITAACKAAKVGRNAFYEWITEDQNFKKQVDEARLSQVCVAEDKLFENVKAGREASIFYFLGNRAADKWRSVNRVEHSGSFTLKSLITGEGVQE